MPVIKRLFTPQLFPLIRCIRRKAAGEIGEEINEINEKMETLLHPGNTGGAIMDLIKKQDEHIRPAALFAFLLAVCF